MSVDNAFAEFMAAHWSRLVHGARLLGADESTAEELAQAALVSCLLRWRRINRISDDPAAYVFRSMLNGWSNGRRSSRVERAAYERLSRERWPEADETSSPGGELDLDELSLDHRAVIVARYFLGLNEADTAEALGIPRRTAKSRHARALQQLRGVLGQGESNTPQADRPMGEVHARARHP